MPGKSYKEREKERREQEILEQAGRLIRASGHGDLNMDQLAEEIGISKPTLYQHFKSKDDLIAHVLMQGMDELEAYLNSIDPISPLEQLQMALRMLLEKRYAADGALGSIEPGFVVLTLRSHEGLRARQERIQAHLTTIIEDGKTRGEITSSLSTPMIRGLLFNLMGLPSAAGMQVIATPQATAEQRETAIRQVVDIFTRAVAQAPTS